MIITGHGYLYQLIMVWLHNNWNGLWKICLQHSKTLLLKPPLGLRQNGLYSGVVFYDWGRIKKKSMKWDFKMVVVIVGWSYFRIGLKEGVYCTVIMGKNGFSCIVFALDISTNSTHSKNALTHQILYSTYIILHNPIRILVTTFL